MTNQVSEDELTKRLQLLFEKTFTKFANETMRQGVIEQIVTEHQNQLRKVLEGLREQETVLMKSEYITVRGVPLTAIDKAIEQIGKGK